MELHLPPTAHLQFASAGVHLSLWKWLMVELQLVMLNLRVSLHCFSGFSLPLCSCSKVQVLKLVLALPGLPAASAWAAGALGKGMIPWHGQEDPGCTCSVMAVGGLETPGPGYLTWMMVCKSWW